MRFIELGSQFYLITNHTDKYRNLKSILLLDTVISYILEQNYFKNDLPQTADIYSKDPCTVPGCENQWEKLSL